MESRITIEVDFDNNNQPVIQIISRESDDVRDKLIKSFFEAFGHTSVWCRAEWVQNHVVNNRTEFQRILIRPIRVSELGKNAEEMRNLAASLAS